MYKCISQTENENEIQEQIIKQSRLGFNGYFLKKMFFNGLYYYKGVYVEKKEALQIITPKQSLFLIARVNHVDECIPVLKKIYGDIPAEYLNGSGLKDVNCNIKFGNIYITEEDTDVSLKNPGLLQRFNNRRKYNIYLPPKYTITQLEQLSEVINVREHFKKWFRHDEIEVRHYRDPEMNEVVIYEGEQALKFIQEEIEKDDKYDNLDDATQHQDEFVFNLEKPKKRKSGNTFVKRAEVNHDIDTNTVAKTSLSEPYK